MFRFIESKLDGVNINYFIRTYGNGLALITLGGLKSTAFIFNSVLYEMVEDPTYYA